MNLNLEQAFDEPVDLSHDLELSRESLARPELTGLQPISVRGRLQRSDPGFVLTGQMSFSGLVECARCLTDVPFTRTADADRCRSGHAGRVVRGHGRLRDAV